MQLILASSSLGRQDLLSRLKIPFITIPSTIDEEKIFGKTPLATLQLRAKKKCEDVLSQITDNRPSRNATHSVAGEQPTTHNLQPTTHNLQPTTHNLQPTTYNLKPKTFILSADSGVILDNQLIGKPKDYTDAVRILKNLSSRTHEFVTAVYVIVTNQELRIKNCELNKTLFLKAGDAREGSQTKMYRSLGNSSSSTRKLKLNNTFKTSPKEKFVSKGRTNTGEVRIWDTKVAGPVNKIYQDYETSKVTFRKLTSKDIAMYLKVTQYHRYAGGYAIASAQNFITKIEGSISNVIGLPLEIIIPLLIEYHLL